MNSAAAALIVSCALMAQADRYGNPSSIEESPTTGGLPLFDDASPNTTELANPFATESEPAAATTTPIRKPADRHTASPGRPYSFPDSPTTPLRNAATESVPALGSTAAANAASRQTGAGTPVGSTNRYPKPVVLMRTMLKPPTGASLTGEPLGLADVLRGATTRWQQSVLIRAYWDLCAAVADYYLGVRELKEFQKVTARGAAWQQAEAELNLRIDTARLAAVATQYRLASLLGRSQADPLPLPSDVPHCGDYRTYYDEIFRGRPSPEAQQLAQLLPMRYKELEDAAAQVIRYKDFLEEEAAHVQANDGTGVVEALVLLALQRRAFIQIAKDYNQRIARYAEIATPGQITTQRLIAMLIESEPTDARVDTAANPTERRTDMGILNRQSRSGVRSTPNTFADDRDWMPRGRNRASTPLRDEAVIPASGFSQSPTQEVEAQSQVERSVLVNPPPNALKTRQE